MELKRPVAAADLVPEEALEVLKRQDLTGVLTGSCDNGPGSARIATPFCLGNMRE